MKIFIITLATAVLSSHSYSQISTSSKSASAKTARAVQVVAERSFPEVNRNKLRVRSFESESSFFKARYSICRFATFRPMRHIIYVNPAAFERAIPEKALEGIVAHELAHVSYYTRKNRFQLLGLIRLIDGSSTIGFERKADLEAITRGYGEGLIAYRNWLYKQISSDTETRKRRQYFSPQEIELVIRAMKEDPEQIEAWKKRAPRSIAEIRRDTGYE